MKLLKRLFSGLPCSCSKRFSRRAGRTAADLVGGDDARRKHREVCEECRLRERREQQYLERLRGAGVPAASDDLTARLLARTEELASGSRPTAPPPDAGQASLLHGSPPEGAPLWGPVPAGIRARTRFTVLTAGGAVAALALITGSAYLMGGSPGPPAGGDASTAFLQKELRVSAAAGTPDTWAAPGWSMTGEPDITPADALTAQQLTALRAQGWACPELRELDFHLVWARGGMVAGTDLVELRLTDGRHFATVLEQHGAPPAQAGAGGQQPEAASPVNVLTGHPAAADGFTASDIGMLSADGGRLWINPAPPFRGIIQRPAATFTYVSDQPADEAGEGLAALVRATAAQGQETPAAEDATRVDAITPGGAAPGEAALDQASPAGITARIERGFGMILELLAP